MVLPRLTYVRSVGGGEQFLDRIEPMLEGQPVVVTLERAHVIQYRRGEDAR